jgi:hypothetical protein
MSGLTRVDWVQVPAGWVLVPQQGVKGQWEIHPTRTLHSDDDSDTNKALPSTAVPPSATDDDNAVDSAAQGFTAKSADANEQRSPAADKFAASNDAQLSSQMARESSDLLSKPVESLSCAEMIERVLIKIANFRMEITHQSKMATSQREKFDTDLSCKERANPGIAE